jgi:hypothetical protein
MSKARRNLFVFTDKRLMKMTVGKLADPSHSAARSNRLWHAFTELILAGLIAWFMFIVGVAGWGYLCFLALLICWFGVSAISTYAGPGSLASRRQPWLVSLKLRSVYKEPDLTIDALKYYDPDFTKNIDSKIADYCNQP